MAIARGRTTLVLTALAVLASATVWVAPAYAACTAVPGSTPGTDVTVAGTEIRVPAISGISICTDGTSVPGARVSTSGGGCNSSCLAVYLLGGEADSGGVTVSWQEDGSTRSQTVNPGGFGGGNEICVLSVGIPDAPDTNCLVVVEPDDDPVQDVRDLVFGSAAPVCDSVPPAYDQWGNETRFCDNPREWVTVFCETNPSTCDGSAIGEFVWGVICSFGIDRPQCPDQ